MMLVLSAGREITRCISGLGLRGLQLRPVVQPGRVTWPLGEHKGPKGASVSVRCPARRRRRGMLRGYGSRDLAF